MNRVLTLYDQALSSVLNDADLTKLKSSIAKNKAIVYKRQIEHFQEGNNENSTTHLLEMFCKYVNDALFHKEGQSTDWICKMVELGAFVAENKLINILRQEENDLRTP